MFLSKEPAGYLEQVGELWTARCNWEMEAGPPHCTSFNNGFLIPTLKCGPVVQCSNWKFPVIFKGGEILLKSVGFHSSLSPHSIGFVSPHIIGDILLKILLIASSGFSHCFQIHALCCTDLQSHASTCECQLQVDPVEQKIRLPFLTLGINCPKPGGFQFGNALNLRTATSVQVS